MMSHLCNRCVRELLILARTWFAFGLPSKPGVTKIIPAFVCLTSRCKMIRLEYDYTKRLAFFFTT
jgi:hypothetical protein